MPSSTIATSSITPKRIAVVGGGISGLSMAYMLQKKTPHHVTLFEEASVAGGHALTVDVMLNQQKEGFPEPEQVQVPVDVGFQVYNLTTYPHLVGFFEELDVTSQPSDMSFGCSVPLYSGNKNVKSQEDEYEVFEWSSIKNLSTIFPEYENLLEKKRYALVGDVLRFEKQAPIFLQEVKQGQHQEMTVGEFLAQFNYCDTFRDVYMLPMIAAIWSVPKVESMVMPMRTLIQFMVNHHLHRIKNRPKWRTVVDRSRQYVDKAVRQLKDVRLGAAVVSVKTDSDDGLTNRVVIQQANGQTEVFDHVILAVHTDIALKLLGEEITKEENEILSKIKYQVNKCVLHTDASIMPENRKLWASWNVKEFPRADGASRMDSAPVCCSYWVNLLQNLEQGVEDVFVTLNPPHAMKNVLLEWNLSHPVLNKEAVEAQENLYKIQGKRNIYFCGAWTRYGFHEDGILSAVKVFQCFNSSSNSGLEEEEVSLPWTPKATSPLPPSRLATMCATLFDKYVNECVKVGSLKLLFPNGSERYYEAEFKETQAHQVVSKSMHLYQGIDLNKTTIVLKIHDLEMFPRIVFGHSSIAMAEAYMDGLFDLSIEDRGTRHRLEQAHQRQEQVDDRLAIFLYWCALNLNAIENNKSLLGGPAQFVGRQIKAFYHWQRQFNTIDQAKKHISMHYDLGNDLYELFLDKSMNYSSGILPFASEELPSTTKKNLLEQASIELEQEQERKLEHAFLCADIQDGHHVLEIGCGWGSMAIYSCQRAKCQWTALTLSKEQKNMMDERVQAAGLQDQIEVLLVDFRELVQMPKYQRYFDRIVSLEMIEALGDSNLPIYFGDINRFLKKDQGRVLIQAITIPDDRYEQYCKNTDFIKEFIFPGGHLPSRARIYWAIQEGNQTVRQEQAQSFSNHTDLCMAEEYEFGKAYASTLRAWRLRFLANRKQILTLQDEQGSKMYDERFMRMFEWYFAYCESGFQQGLIHVVHFVLQNTPTNRVPRSLVHPKIRTRPFQLQESRLMSGKVFHARFEGHSNAFRYPTTMALLNLDDLYLSSLFKDRSYMSLNSSNLLSFHRSDHFGDPKRMLKSCVLQAIQDQCQLDAEQVEKQVGTVFLLTMIRCLGYNFNPISIYYCMSAQDPNECVYVVLEVSNTPWLERICYVLSASKRSKNDPNMIEATFMKEMHVSPFFKMNCDYHIRLNHPGVLTQGQNLRVILDLHDKEGQTSTKKTEPEPEDEADERSGASLGKKMFTASLELKPESLEVDGKTNHDFFLFYSMVLMAWKAQLWIHYQALVLILKGQRIYRASHPAYRGKLRAMGLYSMDLIKHLFIFAVALMGMSVLLLVENAMKHKQVALGTAIGLAVAIPNIAMAAST